MTTPTFRDIAEEAMNKDVKNEETVETNEVSPEAAPVQPEASGTEAGEEEIKPFAEKTDFKGKTPEELERIYDEWQKKYTQTRQREAAELKEYRQKAQEMESRLKQLESAGNQIESPQLQDEKDAVQQQFDLGNLSVQEYTQKMRELLREDAREVARSEFENLRKQDKEETYQQSALEYFNTADNRFNENSPTFDQKMRNVVASQMADLLDEHMKKHGTSLGFDYKGETDKLIREYDQEIDTLVKSRVQQTTAQAKEKAQKLTKSSTPGTNAKSTPSGKKDLRKLFSEKIN